MKKTIPSPPIQSDDHRAAAFVRARESCGSPAPTACATRAVVAIAKPMPGRYETESTFMTMRCAASAPSPSGATSGVSAAIAVRIRISSPAAGSPSPMMRRPIGHDGRHEPAAPPSRTELQPRQSSPSRMSAPIRRLMHDPHALPLAPSAAMPGAP